MSHALPQAALQLRNLMRHVAQPVTVVTARIPCDHSNASSNSVIQQGPNHGATLSSFSSISLYPDPLVAFSLQLPSRLAQFCSSNEEDRFIDVHLLSTDQVELAEIFARQSQKRQSAFLKEDFDSLYTGSVGNLSCRIVQHVALGEAEHTDLDSSKRLFPVSKLFIASVHSVHFHSNKSIHSLLYHDKKYHSIGNNINNFS